MDETFVVQVLFALSVASAAIYAAGKDAVGTATRKAKTLGLAVVFAASAFLVEATNFLSK